MSIEIFEINENGAGWVSLENASTSSLIDLERSEEHTSEL